jgi:beta-glucosidase
MPWLDKVKGVVYAWYGGNECGNAISDIVYGTVNPSGRMPITLPLKEQDIAANLNYKSARGEIYYEEGIWVGYKHHNARSIPTLFPFGHGLSYTTFDYSDLKITTQPPKEAGKADDWKMKVSVTVKNTGKIAGSHSVHFYTLPPKESATGLRHPAWTLQAFTKVYDLQPGSEEVVEISLDKCKSFSVHVDRWMLTSIPSIDAVTHWDEGYKTFRAELGDWRVKVGRDAQSLESDSVGFSIDEELEWTGI